MFINVYTRNHGEMEVYASYENARIVRDNKRNYTTVRTAEGNTYSFENKKYFVEIEF